MYNISLLPNQNAITSVASFSEEFFEDKADFKNLLSELKQTLVESNFLLEQDYGKWFSHEGTDYLHNPKLFQYAPLTCICIFLSELFKSYEIEEISKIVPKTAIKSALMRLSVFKHVQ